MVNKAIVVSPEAAPYRGSPHPQQARRNESSCCGSCIRNLCTLIFFAAIAGGAYYAYVYTDLFCDFGIIPCQDEPAVDNSGEGISGEGIRGNNGTDFIEIFFAENDELSVTNNQQAPYIAAAEFWSDVLRNHTLIPGSPTLGADETIQSICANNELAGNLTINGAEVVDHLIIYVDFFESASSLLGSAGPCKCQTTGGSGIDSCTSSSGLPLIGQMKFNLAQTISEDVVRHEMGHVLGIGTLWNVKGILNNPVTGTIPIPDGNTDNVQPEYVGPEGLAAYNDLTTGASRSFVPVEDGRNADNSIVVPKLGSGSINGHWDKENMGNELMTFSISSGGGAVTSELTLKSLLDLGYNNIDLSFADNVATGTFNSVSSTPNLRGSVYYLIDDMIMPPP